MINLEFSLKNSKIGTMDLKDRMDSSTPSTPERPVSRTSNHFCVYVYVPVNNFSVMSVRGLNKY